MKTRPTDDHFKSGVGPLLTTKKYVCGACGTEYGTLDYLTRHIKECFAWREEPALPKQPNKTIRFARYKHLPLPTT